MKFIANTLAFSSFLIIGLATMLYLGGNGRLPADLPEEAYNTQPLFDLEDSESSPTESPAGPQIQQNILVVGADRIDVASARLESLWLVIIPEDSATITLMPLYPAASLSGPSAYNQPHEPIWFNPQDKFSIAQLPPLVGQGIWWDETVILSEEGFVEIVRVVGSVDGGSRENDHLTVISNAAAVWATPQESLDIQTELLHNLCNLHSPAQSLEAVRKIISLSPSYIQTSLNEFDLIASATQLTMQSNDLQCKFPYVNS